MKIFYTIIGFVLVFLITVESKSQTINRISSTETKNPLHSIQAYTPTASKRAKYNSKNEKVDYKIWSSLLKKNVSATGVVNYKGFLNDIKKFNAFLRILSNTNVNASWSKSEKMSFWINAYNAFTIKLIANNYPVSSIKSISGPWKQKFFSINGELMSLGEIEHGILRGFKDPRIHFAINCASASCPRLIQVPYTAENLNRLLDRQTTEFINDPFYNTITDYTADVSKLFDWYKKDFKEKSGTVINFINQYAKVNINDQKEKGYKNYDWSINSAK